MRNLLAALCLLCAVGISMCSCSDQELKDPSKAAVKYMQYLVDGKYDEYISEMVSCDSASAAYKQNMKVMFFLSEWLFLMEDAINESIDY